MANQLLHRTIALFDVDGTLAVARKVSQFEYCKCWNIIALIGLLEAFQISNRFYTGLFPMLRVAESRS